MCSFFVLIRFNKKQPSYDDYIEQFLNDKKNILTSFNQIKGYLPWVKKCYEKFYKRKNTTQLYERETIKRVHI
jgi:hypothetical protein